MVRFNTVTLLILISSQTFSSPYWLRITLVNKKILFFQKSLNVKMILGYIKVAEPKYALSFFKLALVFEI